MDEVSRQKKQEIKPCDYFHLIAGAGMGGIIALLLGRLQLTVSQCIHEYWALSSLILRKEVVSPDPPLFDAQKLKRIMNGIVEKYIGNKNNSLLDPSTKSNTKTVIFAVPADAQDDRKCLRIYKTADQESDELTLSNDVSISDIAVAAVAARGLFEPAPLRFAGGKTVWFLDKLYPLGLINPAHLVWNELQSLPDVERRPDLILSLGSGKPENDDIPYLLELEPISGRPFFPKRQIQRVFRRFGNLVKRQNSTTSNLSSKTSGEQGLVDKVAEHLKKEEKTPTARIPFDVYRRLEMPAVPDVGPNDFLSFEEVSGAAHKLFDSIKLRQSISFLKEGQQFGLNWAACTGNSTAISWVLRTQEPSSIRQYLNGRDEHGRTPLHWALDSGSVDAVSCLIDSHCLEYPPTNRHGMKPHELAERSSTAESGPHNFDDFTPFELAAQQGNEKAIETFSEALRIFDRKKKGLDFLEARFPEALGVPRMFRAPLDPPPLLGKDEVKRALSLSIEHGHWKVMELLEEQFGVNFNVLHKDQKLRCLIRSPELATRRFGNKTLLHLAAEQKDIELIKALMKIVPEVDELDGDNQTALHHAIIAGAADIVEFLLKNGADIRRENKAGDDAFMLVIRHSHREPSNGRQLIAEMLLQQGADVKRMSSEGETALTLVIHNGSVESATKMATFLIQNGVDVNQRNKDGSTALMAAFDKGSQALCLHLISLGADSDTLTKDSTPVLQAALSKGMEALSERLLETGLQRNPKMKGDNTAIRMATSRGYCGVLKMFLAAGGDFSQRSSKGESLLHLAARSGSFETLKLLVNEARLPLDQTTTDGYTVLDQVALAGNLRAVEVLVRVGADLETVTENDKTAFELTFDEWLKSFGYVNFWKQRDDLVSVMNFLLQSGAKVRKMPNGDSLAHFVVRQQLDAIWQFFGMDEAKALIDDRNNDGHTPLHIAVLEDNVEKVRALLNAGADQNIQDNNKRLAIQLTENERIKKEFAKWRK
ncbi:ankyrin repeat [Fusarium pseudocircinatum]|uniref:Ankyrin repeat n=1 Tax=Fusarium pseudocircinatum TaxID=56676 RepID=A0A8H5KNH0_9HYPO|nr:ankyrin repeat [Fusarium pseudocircinatum]